MELGGGESSSAGGEVEKTSRAHKWRSQVEMTFPLVEVVEVRA